MNLATYMSGVLFTKAHKIVRIKSYEVLRKYDLNPTYWSILSVTTQSPEGIRLANVASMLGVKAPVITTESSALIERNLIRRIPHHSDHRAKLLVITQKGKKLTQIIENELNHEVGGLLDGLTTEEMMAFQKTLQTIINNSKKQNSDKN
jgi:MarR family transcriptional regulator for hemolysin